MPQFGMLGQKPPIKNFYRKKGYDGFKPLFQPGFHDIDLSDIDGLFVEPFKDCTRREELVGKLRLFLNALSKINAHFEIWIDGSFATEKIKPGDIDIAIIYKPQEIDNLSSDQIIFLKTDHKILKIRYNLDVYYVPMIFIRKVIGKDFLAFHGLNSPKVSSALYRG